MNIIWANVVGNGKWKVAIHAISHEVMNRGILSISTLDDQVLFQKEVPVDRKLQFGGTAVHMKQWRDIIENWIANSSPSHPPAAAPSDPQE
jgi:hypothetical protein